MKRIGAVIIIILMICLLISCSTSSNNNSIKGEQVNLLEFEGNKLEILKVKAQYLDGKFVQLEVIDEDKKRDIFFNTEEDRFDSDLLAQLPENRYQFITEEDGILKVVDRNNNQTVLERDLIKNDSFSTIEDLSFEWSNTGKYLFVYRVKTQDYFLFDIIANKKIEIPVSLIGYIGIEWSGDDNVAIITHNDSDTLNFSMNHLIIWRIEGNTLQEIDYNEATLYYRWSPDNKSLFSIELSHGEDESSHKPYNYKVSRYSTENKQWSDIYKTDKSIDIDSFKVLNNNQFIYAGNAINETDDPQTALLKPRQDFIVKVDYSKNVEIAKKLDSVLPKVFFWSFDNKYIYYQDRKGFFKAQVDF